MLWKRGRRYWTKFHVEGQLYQLPLKDSTGRTTTDRRAAWNLEKELIALAQQGKLAIAGRARPAATTFADAAKDFLEHKRSIARSPRTVEYDAERLHILKRELSEDTRLRDITPAVIEAFQRRRRAAGIKPRTVNMDIGVLRKLLKRYKLWSRIEDDVTFLSESGGQPIGRALTEEEQRRLLTAAQGNPDWSHVYTAATLAANTSMRGIEIKQLQVRDFDEIGVLHIRRSKNETSLRRLPLNADALAAIQTQLTQVGKVGPLQPDWYIWPNLKGNGYRPEVRTQSWVGAWRKLCKAAGLPGLRFHDLRHTVVTRLLEAGEPDHVVQAITGHLSKRMLEHYSHIRMAAKRGALDRLGHAQGALQGLPGGHQAQVEDRRAVAATREDVHPDVAGADVHSGVPILAGETLGSIAPADGPDFKGLPHERTAGRPTSSGHELQFDSRAERT